jgi:hypothetical protein
MLKFGIVSTKKQVRDLRSTTHGMVVRYHDKYMDGLYLISPSLSGYGAIGITPGTSWLSDDTMVEVVGQLEDIR